MFKKKNIGIIILTTFLIWSLGDTISRGSRSSFLDYMILDHYNLIRLGYSLIAGLLIGNIVSLFAIFNRKQRGTKILYLFFIFNVIETLSVMLLMLMDLGTAKEVYTQSRTMRGLDISNINEIISQNILIIESIIYISFYGLLGWFVHKKRTYFLK